MIIRNQFHLKKRRGWNLDYSDDDRLKRREGTVIDILFAVHS